MIFRCKVCHKPVQEYSLISGIAKPCGHCQLDKNTIGNNKELLRDLNAIASEAIRR